MLSLHPHTRNMATLPLCTRTQVLLQEISCAFRQPKRHRPLSGWLSVSTRDHAQEEARKGKQHTALRQHQRGCECPARPLPRLQTTLRISSVTLVLLERTAEKLSHFLVSVNKPNSDPPPEWPRSQERDRAFSHATVVLRCFSSILPPFMVGPNFSRNPES
jgi:hypothetical protein